MKFDIRKYILANVIAVMQYFLIILAIVRHNIEFPPYQPGWGEGPVPSAEESGFFAAEFICLFFWYASFLFLPIEIIVRFLFRKFVTKRTFFIELKFPKFIVIIYSILFYIAIFHSLGFLFFAYVTDHLLYIYILTVLKSGIYFGLL